ncbi:unnamed protein product [Urochloa decumbens]|uniref:F-box domain-containing protein n=1 Tax=Urochloa decumbens TaxID=240449 RepID=A0ABC8YFN6_9POAL
MDHQINLSSVLPDDVLADALGRLAPRDLAVSRSVCKAWRDAVDGYGILRTELLPLSLAGFLINYNWRSVTEFFARPPKTRALSAVVSGEHHDFLAEGDIGSWETVLDHCNGLLLIKYYGEDDGNRRTLEVFNPATRCWDPVPPCPPLGDEMMCAFTDEHLAYDPAVSPHHYQVFSIPSFGHRGKVVDPDIEKMEWPPATYVLHVFSSVTRRWEERSFVREGGAAGSVADMRRGWSSERNAVYRQGELFVHCQTNFVMRLSLSNDKYHVIKPPAAGVTTMYLGKSEKGIYCASFVARCKLRVWILNESCFPMEWVLKYDHDLLGVLTKKKLCSPYRNHDEQQVRGPWTFLDINYSYSKNTDVNPKALVKEEFAWTSDASDDEATECVVDSEDRSFYSGYFDILGFHPYKEIIFLSQTISMGLAYHLNSSTIQDLGNLYPKDYDQELPNERFIQSSFPYTPCWIELI